MAIHTQELSCDAGGVTMKNFLAYDDSISGARPAVMVVHEWWGLDDYIRGRCKQLAEAGFAALGVDMYGGGQTGSNPDEAGALMNAVFADIPAASERIKGAAAALGATDQADADRMACMGYCFGGAVSLHAARLGMNLRGVVSFHGVLGSFHTADPGSIKAKILVLHGAADVLVPDEQVDGFKAEMATANADYEFVAYDGAMHGYTNPEATERGNTYGLPLAYDAATDKKSWQDMMDFFGKVMA
tara:strand:+ start:2277 stop:3008 length:732 start_codon:yes stop_codon:yes gene_type:complete